MRIDTGNRSRNARGISSRSSIFVVITTEKSGPGFTHWPVSGLRHRAESAESVIASKVLRASPDARSTSSTTSRPPRPALLFHARMAGPSRHSHLPAPAGIHVPVISPVVRSSVQTRRWGSVEEDSANTRRQDVSHVAPAFPYRHFLLGHRASSGVPTVGHHLKKRRTGVCQSTHSALTYEQLFVMEE